MKKKEIAIVDLPGGRELISFFGDTNFFHDSEIIYLNISTKNSSSLVIRAATYDKNAIEDGVMKKKHAGIVEFCIKDICNMQLNEFSRQNILGGIKFFQSKTRGLGGETVLGYEMELIPSFGIYGFLIFRDINIILTVSEDS